MIVISMLLVAVGFVTLMLGVLGVGEEPLLFVYASIAACLVAAVFLIVGVLRGRPSRKPLVTSGGQDASWAGASAWGSAAGNADAGMPLPRNASERTVLPGKPASPDEVEVVGPADEAHARPDNPGHPQI